MSLHEQVSYCSQRWLLSHIYLDLAAISMRVYTIRSNFKGQLPSFLSQVLLVVRQNAPFSLIIF